MQTHSMGELWEESGCKISEGESQKTRSEEGADQRTTKSDRGSGCICSAKGQKGLGVEPNRFTSMKTQKTGTVSADSTKRSHVLTPRFSPPLGVLDLRNG